MYKILKSECREAVESWFGETEKEFVEQMMVYGFVMD